MKKKTEVEVMENWSKSGFMEPPAFVNEEGFAITPLILKQEVLKQIDVGDIYYTAWVNQVVKPKVVK